MKQEEPPAPISKHTGKDLIKDPDLKNRIRTVIADAVMDSNNGSDALIKQMWDYNRRRKYDIMLTSAVYIQCLAQYYPALDAAKILIGV
ncbi:hypothetical protein Landi51_05112 [Colletotrichum acutatum]